MMTIYALAAKITYSL